jgi:hypothetical protein
MASADGGVTTYRADMMLKKGPSGYGIKIDKGRAIITGVDDNVIESTCPVLVADKVVAVDGQACDGYAALEKLLSVPEGSSITLTVQRAVLEDADRQLCPVCMETYDELEHAPVISVTCQHAICRGCAALLGDKPCVICRRRRIIFGESKKPTG